MKRSIRALKATADVVNGTFLHPSMQDNNAIRILEIRDSFKKNATT